MTNKMNGSVPQISKTPKNEIGGSSDRFWNPRFWDGMTMSAWVKILKSGNCRITPSRLAMAGLICGLSVANSTFALGQKLLYGKTIRETALVSPPIFIIGHWRSGTTLLHEYLIRDPQFTYCDTYTCFAPSHFLVSSGFFRPWVKYLMPKKRPMDNMLAGLERPQEDEFAICALGMNSPYRDILFPNTPPIDDNFLTLRNLTDQQRKEWLDIFEYFLKTLTVAEKKTIILKSPPHTGRIRTILERFPDAKFIHIHRNPYTLFPSTHTLWMKLAQTHGLQHPNGKGLEEKILQNFEDMYAAFDADLPLLKPTQFVDVSYDELTQTPVNLIEKVYSTLQIDHFDEVRQNYEQFAETQKNYKKNKFQLDQKIVELITKRWDYYIKRYGYKMDI
ncbi:MAG: sulfotransferase [Planctomycetia bacterium]|nr:sulfotransferase [Planctomycetia bacterium]